MKKTIYKFQEREIILEEIISVNNDFAYDENKQYLIIYTRGGLRIEVSIKANDQERDNNKKGGMVNKFRERAKREFEDFRIAWRESNGL